MTDKINLDRRKFLHNIALLTAGVVAADQLEILERLTHKRKFFPSADLHRFPRAGEVLRPGDLVELRKDGLLWKVEFGDTSNALFNIHGIVTDHKGNVATVANFNGRFRDL